MAESVKIKYVSEHLKIFAIFFRIDVLTIQKEMIKFIQKLEIRPSETKKKVESWFSGEHCANEKGRAKINLFFDALLKNEQKKGNMPRIVWCDKWIETPVKDLKTLSGVPQRLIIAIEKKREPCAIARSFSAHNRKDISEQIINIYGHRNFFIYRIHSSADGSLDPNGKLVRDYLRIGSNDGKFIFCKMYQYSDHEGLDIKNVLFFQGNVYFNKHNFLINFATTKEKGEHGLQYGTIMVPHGIQESSYNKYYPFVEKEQNGILMSTTDTAAHPAAAAVLFRSVRFEEKIRVGEEKPEVEFKMDKIEVYVKELTPEFPDYKKIKETISGKGFTV